MGLWPCDRGRGCDCGPEKLLILIHLGALSSAGAEAEAGGWCEHEFPSLSLSLTHSASPSSSQHDTPLWLLAVTPISPSPFLQPLTPLTSTVDPQPESQTFSVTRAHVVSIGDSKVKPHALPPPGHAGPMRVDRRQPAMSVKWGRGGDLLCHWCVPQSPDPQSEHVWSAPVLLSPSHNPGAEEEWLPSPLPVLHGFFLPQHS